MDTKVIDRYFQAKRELRRHTIKLYIVGIASSVFLLLTILSIFYAGVFLSLITSWAAVGLCLAWLNFGTTEKGKSQNAVLRQAFLEAEQNYNAEMHKEYKIYESLIIAEMDKIADASERTER